MHLRSSIWKVEKKVKKQNCKSQEKFLFPLRNVDSRLFDVTSELMYLQNVGILRISERPDKRARVTLYAPWLYADYLNHFKDGSNLDLVSNHCGDPRRYSGDHVIVRMRNCIRLCKWMRSPLPLESGTAGRLDVCLSLECDAEFLTNDPDLGVRS